MGETLSGLTSLLRRIGGGATEPRNRHVTAIILAGGLGSRMQSEDGTTKQMIELCGMPVIAHTVSAFEASDAVCEIVLVAREEELCLYPPMIEKYGWKKVKRIVAGGMTRRESALEGFKVISDETELVLIHDGARCLVTDEIIESVARAGLVHGAAIAAERVTSTVKREDGKGLIAETIDRRTVWLAQTPQAFGTEVYRAAVYLHLSKGGGDVTDDAMLAEQIDLPVKLVDCGQDNLKITTPRDLRLARLILEERAQAEEQAAVLAARTEADRREDRERRKEARGI